MALARFRLFLALALILVACTASDEGTSSTTGGAGGHGGGVTLGSTSAVIDAKGGTLTLGGMSIVIPPFALDDGTMITVEATNDPAPEGVTPLSPIYKFSPDGLKFKLPVTVTIPYQGGAEDAVIYWSDGSGGWDQSGMIGIVAEGAVTTDELHFSSGFVSNVTHWRKMLCDNTDIARQKRGSCENHAGDICLDNTPQFPIQYIFVLMLENHSFDNYFGRFQAYLKAKGYSDARTAAGGVEVPATPYELRSPQGQMAEDQKTDLCTHDPTKDAPYNPEHAGQSPAGGCNKHYWKHAAGDGDQCLSDTCHEWWCAHMQVDGGRMDGFFESNDGFFEGGAAHVGYPPIPRPKDWYDRNKHPDAPGNGTLLRGDRAMVYYDETDIPFYYWAADAFGLADHYHSSVIGPTFVNRDYLYGATSRGLTSNSSDYYGNGATNLVHGPFKYAGNETANPPVPQFILGQDLHALNTIYDDCDYRGVPYTQWVRNRYSYVAAVPKWGAWFGGGAIFADSHKYVYDDHGVGNNGFEYYVEQENAKLVKAIKDGADPATVKPQGKIYPVNFIDPDPLEDVNGEDEHPSSVPQGGQRLSYDVIRALMANPEVWKRSVLFITWDEHGGLYDHVNPPKACPPDKIAPKWSGAYGGGAQTSWKDGDHVPRQGSNRPDQSDARYGGAFDQYGVRVPLLVISPWVKHQYVSHYVYDHTSIVRFIEARFHMPALTERDANADPMFDFFDFSQAPQKLRGQVAAPKECIACGAQWGTESIVSGGVYADAAALGNRHSTNAVRFEQKANPTCLALFPPVKSPGLGSALGAKVYGGYDWSRGKRPPLQYTCGGGGGDCCQVQICGLSHKWCASQCQCTLALECPPGDYILGGCECCAQFDPLDPLSCLICDSLEDVSATYCPGG